MTTVPLGASAYRRLYAGEPEIILLNRWLEKNPSNLREHTALLARPGTTFINSFSPGSYSALTPMRGNFALNGLFNESLFVACGETLYRINADMSVTTITGVLGNGNVHPEVAWQKGIGYERLFISDGLNLQFYAGTTHATGTLSGTPTTQTIKIGTTYYIFAAAITGGDGSVGNPFQVHNSPNAFDNLVAALNASGTPGTDYSTLITAQNASVMGTAQGSPSTTSVLVTARAAGAGGNSIATVVTSGAGIAWTHATLTNGGIDALQGVSFPDGAAVSSLAQVSSYVLASKANTQQFYWINPGEVTIDPLNFASKESSPDPIVSMRTVGDQVLMMGAHSTENWYATGNSAAPFAPIEGRVYQRGSHPGSAVILGDAVVLVGDDGRVYTVGYQYTEDVSWGIQRISDNGIEERIRRQTRREAGLTP